MAITKHVQSISLGLSSDGRAYLLQVTTLDGESQTFISNMDTIVEVISGLLRSSQEAVRKLPAIEGRLQDTSQPENPIEARSARCIRSERPGESVLSVDTGGLQLSFSLPHEQLLDLKRTLEAHLSMSDSSRVH
ncbi:MAG: hypothetical protein ACOC0U_04495 [Desulfovibrionales bacterium]